MNTKMVMRGKVSPQHYKQKLYHICSNFSSEQLSGKKRHLEWNCKVSERWRIIGMGGRILRIDDGEVEPSKNGRF